MRGVARARSAELLKRCLQKVVCGVLNMLWIHSNEPQTDLYGHADRTNEVLADSSNTLCVDLRAKSPI